MKQDFILIKSNAENNGEFYRRRNSSLSGDSKEAIEMGLKYDNHDKSIEDIKLNTNNEHNAGKENNNANELIINIPHLVTNNINNVDKNNSKENNNGKIDDFSSNKNNELEKEVECEHRIQSAWSTLWQMLIPFLIASMGSVTAGIVLNNVQHWPAFDDIPQLMIMMPAFMGLTGNIETTLASRLSTHANLGTLDIRSQLRKMLIGNLAVVQCQASSVGLFASFASVIMSLITGEGRDGISLRHVLILSSSAVISSIIINTILSTVISIVVVLSRKFHINPDNVTTPIAASMGDVVTITLLANVSDFLYQHSQDSVWMPTTALVVLFAIYAPITATIARKIEYTRVVILTGWTPILGAVIIEQPGGVVMENAFSKYDVMSTFQPLVNGIGSNLDGIQSSRLSTYLHQTCPPKVLPKSNPKACVSPLHAFFGSDHASMLRLLLAIALPVHFLYLVIIRFWENNFVFTAPFIIAYMIAIFIQVSLLLYLGYNFVLFSWKIGLNPDNSSIPITSALADVFGNISMAVAFTLLNSMGDINAMPNDEQTVNLTLTIVNSVFNTSITQLTQLF